MLWWLDIIFSVKNHQEKGLGFFCGLIAIHLIQARSFKKSGNFLSTFRSGNCHLYYLNLTNLALAIFY